MISVGTDFPYAVFFICGVLLYPHEYDDIVLQSTSDPIIGIIIQATGDAIVTLRKRNFFNFSRVPSFQVSIISDILRANKCK